MGILLGSLQPCLNLLIHLACWQDLDLGLSFLPGQGGQLNLLWSLLGHIQGFGENLKITSVTCALSLKF